MSHVEKPQGIGSRGKVNWRLDDSATVQQLDEGCFQAYNFGFGNVGFVITSEGVVVIDSTISKRGAHAIVAEIRKRTDLPIKYLIYTHGHGDHVGGASVFKEEGATIIGHRNIKNRFDRHTKLGKHHLRINSLQFQKNLKEPKKVIYNYPDITYDEEYVFELGGLTFRLVHGKGESDDATVLYIPEKRLAYIGDFIIWAFPNIGNPNKVIRYEIEWAEMLDRILSWNPKIVAPGHGKALITEQEINECLTITSDVLKYLHDECVEHINKGSTIDEMLQEIQLPEKFLNNLYIQPTYGNREFVIRGIHRRYTGWYDENPTNLSLAPTKDVNDVILSLIEDQEKIIDKIKECEREENYQMALHLIDLILLSESKNDELRAYKGEILNKMSAQSENLFYVNFYKGSAQIELARSKKENEL